MLLVRGFYKTCFSYCLFLCLFFLWEWVNLCLCGCAFYSILIICFLFFLLSCKCTSSVRYSITIVTIKFCLWFSSLNFCQNKFIKLWKRFPSHHSMTTTFEEKEQNFEVEISPFCKKTGQTMLFHCALVLVRWDVHYSLTLTVKAGVTKLGNVMDRNASKNSFFCYKHMNC